MKIKLIYLFFILSVVPYSACSRSANENNVVKFNNSQLAEIEYRDRLLWDSVVRPYLQEPLWSPRDIYDSSHHLMVPLHASFTFKELQWQQDFSEHFRRFLLDYPTGMKNGEKYRLDRLHYFYLLSRYLALSCNIEKDLELKTKLYNVVSDEIDKIWNNDPAWQWGRSPFHGGMRERVLWKLNTSSVPLSYYRAIIDEELFTFAISADLLFSSKLGQQKSRDVLLDILSVARKVFENEVVWGEDGGWLFQPGVWADGPGHLYAGQTVKRRGVAESPVSDVAWDSSHSHRFPLWLTSLKNAYNDGTKNNFFYHRLIEGLEKQLNQKVLVPPDKNFSSWRMNNYMDGRNGLYRWREKDGFGYGPYELSGTFLIGWWTFLNSERVGKVYNDIYTQFPLSESVINLYVGPNASRERHPLVTLPNQYKNGLIELIVRFASMLPRHSNLSDDKIVPTNFLLSN